MSAAAYDVIIVGAGIVGAACAEECSRQGMRVAVADQEAVSGGATAALAFSRDPAQTFMFVVNQNNSRIDIVERQSGKVVSALGQIGNLPGQFNQPHSVAVDSQNNLYVGENRGRRIHKFTQKPTP